MNKTKSLLVATFAASAVLGAASVASANPEFYAGAQLGYQDISLKTVEQGSGFEGTIDGEAIDGFAGSIFAGTKFNLNNDFFVGAEANVGTSTAEYKDNFGDGDSGKIEAKISYGIAALAGINLTADTALYGRLGYQRTKLDFKYDDSEKLNFNGVRVGVGMETALAQQLALRLDWSQTYYSSKSEQDDWGTFKAEPTESLFQVGVSYQF